MALPKKLTYGSYEVLQNPDGSPCLLGQGSFGVTYKARHVLLGRINALKVIREDLLNRGSKEDQEETNRFLSEARAVGKLHHPGIAMVHDCALDMGVFYYAMEYCDGGTLDDRCEKCGPMPWDEVRVIAQQIAAALDYAHASGFLHRDIKPANIMLNGAGKARQAKLIDFGLAKKFASDTEASSATVHNDTENFRGNFATASPEQILEKPLDQRSDLFSFGVTLWWLLIGKNPFGELKRGPLIADRVGPSSYDSSLPSDLDPEARELLVGLLEKDAQKRIATAHEVVERLDTAGSRQPPSAAPTKSPSAPAEPLQAPPDVEDAYALGGIHLVADHAKLYLAEHLVTGQDVIVIIPDPSLAPDARSAMRVAASRRLDIGAYAFHDWRSSSGDDVFVISKPVGCSLLSILRKFGPARFIDALPWMTHLARCFDTSHAWTSFGIQVDPNELLFTTRHGSIDLHDFRAWSDIDAHSARCLPLFTSGADHGVSSEATLSTSIQEFPPLAQFAALLYRILAGSAVRYAAFFTTNGYVMASGLSEDGNALIADTLCDPDSQPSACRFVQLLASLESQPVAEITPLVNPPSALDIEIGKLVPTPAPISAAKVVARGKLLGKPTPENTDNSLSVNDKVAELERQLAIAKLAAEQDARRETERLARLAAEAQQAADTARRKQEDAQRIADAKNAAELAARLEAEESQRKQNEARLQQAEIKRLDEQTKRIAAEEKARQQTAATLQAKEQARQQAEAKQAAANEARRQQEAAKRLATEEKARLKNDAAKLAAEEKARLKTQSTPPSVKPTATSPAAIPAAITSPAGDATRSKRKILSIAAILVGLITVAAALVINNREKNRAGLAEEKARHDQELADHAEIGARQPIVTTPSADQALAAKNQAAEKIAADQAAEAKRIADAKLAAEPKLSTLKISMASHDPATKNEGYHYTSFKIDEIGGKGRFDATESKAGFQAKPDSQWKITLLGDLDGNKDQPLASVAVSLPKSPATKDIDILLPSALAEILVINKYDNADYNQIRIIGPEPSAPTPILLSGTSRRLITNAELMADPAVVSEKNFKFPNKTTPLHVPAPGHEKWSLTYTGSRLSDKEVSISNSDNVLTHRIETPSPFSGRYSLIAPMTRFPENLRPTQTAPVKVGDNYEVDYFNEMVYLGDENPQRLEFIASIKQSLPAIDCPHFLCVYMELDLKNNKALTDGKMSALLTYPHALFVQYPGIVSSIEIAPEGALTLTFKGTEGLAADVLLPDVKVWAERYAEAIKAKDARALNNFLFKTFNEWVTWQRLNKDQGSFSLDFGKWTLEPVPSDFRFEIASSDGSLRMNKAVQIYTKLELYHGHAKMDASPEKVRAVLLKDIGKDPARIMQRHP